MAEGGRRRLMEDEDDLANVEFETSEDVDVIPTFDSMGLRDDLLRGIYAYGKRKNLCGIKNIFPGNCIPLNLSRKKGGFFFFCL